MDLIEQAALDLRRDVDTQQSESRAAEVLRDAARDGRDLEPAYAALADALDRAPQYGIRAPTAEALARFLVRTRQGARLRELFESAEGSEELSTALRNLAREGADLEPVADALLAPLARFDAADVFGAWAYKDPKPLQTLLPRLAAANPQAYLRVAEKVWWDERTEEVSLRDLGPFLTSSDPAVRRRAAALAQRTCWSADLRELRVALRDLTGDDDEWTRKWAVYALTIIALRDNDAAWLRELDQVGAAEARREAVEAAGGFMSRGSDLALETLLHLVLDRAQTVRAAALDKLHEAEKKHGRLPIADDWQARFEAAATDEATEALALLGVDDEPCQTCLALPRAGHWNSQYDVPAAYHALVGDESGLATCPDCGNVYERTYDVEYEDMSQWESWAVRRLSPTEARTLPGAPGDGWRERYDEEIARHERRLSHPRARLREDAGWALALHHLDADRWTALRHLVHEADRDAALAAAQAIEASGKAGDAPTTFYPGPGEALAPMVRMRVTRGLRENGALVHEALGTSDPVTLAATLEVVDSAHRDGARVAPYLERILELMGHEDADVRRLAYWIVGRLDGPAQVEQVVERAVALLEHDDAKVREGACRIIAHSAKLRPAPEAVPRLVAMLDDSVTYWGAAAALQALAENGVGIGAARARIVGRISKSPQQCWVDDLELCEHLRAQGHDVSKASPGVVTIVGGGTGNKQARALQLLLQLIQDGMVDAETLDAAQHLMPRLYGAQTQELAHFLARARWQAGDERNLRAMLGSTTTVAWATIDVLGEALDRGEDVSAFVEAVQAVHDAHPGVVADHAKTFLDRAKPRRHGPPRVDTAELERLLAEFRSSVDEYDAWDHAFMPNPYSPTESLAELVALGPGVIPSLCEIARGSDRELSYWAIHGLMSFGPDAGTEALETVASLVEGLYVSPIARRAVAAMDEQRFFALGLHKTPAVGRVAETRQATRTAAAWLRRVFELHSEEAATLVVDGLKDIDPTDTELIAVLRDALTSRFPAVRRKAAWLLGKVPETAPLESLISAMEASGIVAPVEAVAFHPDSVRLVPVLAQRGNVGVLAELLRRRRCAGLETPPALARAAIEDKLRNPKREDRYEEHDVHDAARCAYELGDVELLPALVAAIVRENSGYAWNALIKALTVLGEVAADALRARRAEVGPEMGEPIDWMLERLGTLDGLDNDFGDQQFLDGNIDHALGCAFDTYADVLRREPSAHAAFQLAWIDRAFGAPITRERIAWIRNLGFHDEALLDELGTAVPPLQGLRYDWGMCDDPAAALAAGLPSLAFKGSRDPDHATQARAHVERVRAASTHGGPH